MMVTLLLLMVMLPQPQLQSPDVQFDVGHGKVAWVPAVEGHGVSALVATYLSEGSAAATTDTWHGMAWHGMAWHGMAWQHVQIQVHCSPCGAVSGAAVGLTGVLGPASVGGPAGWADTSPLAGVCKGAPPLADAGPAASEGAATPEVPLPPLGTPSLATSTPAGKPVPLAPLPLLGEPTLPGSRLPDALEGSLPVPDDVPADGTLDPATWPRDVELPPAAAVLAGVGLLADASPVDAVPLPEGTPLDVELLPGDTAGRRATPGN
jgi:hypothetical protein